MNKVRTIVIDGTEIQTSLTAVEIADLPIINAEQKQQIERLISNWNELEEDINNRLHTITMHPYMIQSYEYVLDKMKEIKERNND